MKIAVDFYGGKQCTDRYQAFESPRPIFSTSRGGNRDVMEDGLMGRARFR